MDTRLQQFLAAENISQAQLADTLKVARASVSHIIAGRNKPGYDFISSLLRCYPTLNPDWLINGKGKMYRTAADNASSVPGESGNVVVEDDDLLFPDSETIAPQDSPSIQTSIIQTNTTSQLQPDIKHRQADISQLQPDIKHSQADISQFQSEIKHRQADISQLQPEIRQRQAEIKQRKAVRIVVLYDDGTYQEL